MGEKATNIISKAIQLLNTYLYRGKKDVNDMIQQYIIADKKEFESFIEKEMLDSNYENKIVKMAINILLNMDKIENENLVIFLKDIEEICKDNISKFHVYIITPLFFFILRKYPDIYKYKECTQLINNIKNMLNKKIYDYYKENDKDFINETVLLCLIYFKKDKIFNSLNQLKTRKVFNFLLLENSYLLYQLYINDVDILNIRSRVNKLIIKNPEWLKIFLDKNIKLLSPPALNIINDKIEKNIFEKNKKTNLINIVDSYKDKSNFEFVRTITIDEKIKINGNDIKDEIYFQEEIEFVWYINRIVNININHNIYILDNNEKDDIFYIMSSQYDNNNNKIKDEVSLNDILTLERIKYLNDLSNYLLEENIKNRNYGKIDIFKILIHKCLNNHIYKDMFENKNDLICDLLIEGYKGNWYLFCGIIPIFENIFGKLLTTFCEDKKISLTYKHEQGVYHEKALSTLIKEGKNFEGENIIRKFFCEQMIENLDLLFGDKQGNLRNKYCHGLLCYEEEKNLIRLTYCFMINFFLFDVILKK